MRPYRFALLAVLLAPLLFSGCDTVAVRVLTDCATFSKLDPKIRANIIRGRIALGSTPRCSATPSAAPTAPPSPPPPPAARRFGPAPAWA